LSSLSTRSLAADLQHKIDQKTKPAGALGHLETIALQLGMLQNTLAPYIRNPQMVIFAADHGIAATGLVNPFPQAVTAQMVQNFVAGGAAINVFCRQMGMGLTVVDVGVASDFDPILPIVHAKVAYGTANYQHGPALTAAQVTAAMQAGAGIVQNLHAQGCNTIGFGEMGIGNTSSAALLMSALLNIPLADCVGAGTGAHGEKLLQKIHVLEAVARAKQSAYGTPPDAMHVLEQIGGLEIAALVGAYRQAANFGMAILIDGFICTAALLVAHAQQPDILLACFFAHQSSEHAHGRMLQALGATPLLQLGLRLGEGTGAALALPILQAACAFVNEMASFESAAISGQTPA